MKVLWLGAASSIHTVQWARRLAAAGVEVVVASQHEAESEPPGVALRTLPFLGAAGYVANTFILRGILEKEKPDLLHAHYASGYGTTAALSRFKPLLLSVWGSDVYEFPQRSWLHRCLLRSNLKAATVIASTSRAMAHQTRSMLPSISPPEVIPFGVDINHFTPRQRSKSPENTLVIGTVKSLRHVYGIDLLLRSFAIVRTRIDFGPGIQLRIVGGGEDLEQLRALAQDLGIADCTTFVGAVPHERVAEELRRLDIFVALSRSESFGVAVVEAGSCALPTVVSNVGGLAEVVQDGRTGFIVPAEDPYAAAGALESLIMDAGLRQAFGHAARAMVVKHFNWTSVTAGMIDLYQRVIDRDRARLNSGHQRLAQKRQIKWRQWRT